MRETLRALLTSRRVIALAVLVGVGVSLPSLGLGLMHDDYLHRNAYEHRIEAYTREAHQLYDFLPRDPAFIAAARREGALPWWTEDSLSIRFFRPLSSLTLAADMKLFGEAIWAAHLHSLLWLAALIAAAALALRRALPREVSGLAILLFALCRPLTMPGGWLAARHVSVTSVFLFLGLWLHLKGREERRPGLRALSLLALGLALLSGEMALAAFALIFAYELLGGPRAEIAGDGEGESGEVRGTGSGEVRGTGAAPLRSRIVALLPLGGLFLVWLIFYVSAGYGTRGTWAYIHPVHEPGRFFGQALLRVPALVGDLLGGLPAPIAMSVPDLLPGMAGFGYLTAAIAALLLYLMRARITPATWRALRWLLLGGLLALFPGSAGPLGGRLLIPALLGSTALMATLLIALWAARREAAGVARWTVTLALLIIGGAHLVMAPLARVGLLFVLGTSASEEARIARSAEYCEGHSIVLASGDPAITSYVPAAYVYFGGAQPRFYEALSMAPHDHRVENVTERSFELVVLTGEEERRGGMWERVHRAAPYEAGEAVDLGPMRVEVLEVRGPLPMRLRASFDRPLDDPELCFLDYRDGELRRIELPPPGESMLLPRTLGPMGL